MQLICGRMAFDGDMASSGAAHDPLFWVAHGAVERLYQRVVFEGILADTEYRQSEVDKVTCSGHTADGTKAWLKGYQFEDASVDPTTLTNAELADVLDPTGDKYRDYLNFVYDDSTWSWCDGFDGLFETARKAGDKTEEKEGKEKVDGKDGAKVEEKKAEEGKDEGKDEGEEKDNAPKEEPAKDSTGTGTGAGTGTEEGKVDVPDDRGGDSYEGQPAVEERLVDVPAAAPVVGKAADAADEPAPVAKVVEEEKAEEKVEGKEEKVSKMKEESGGKDGEMTSSDSLMMKAFKWSSSSASSSSSSDSKSKGDSKTADSKGHGKAI